MSALAWGCFLLQESWPSGRAVYRKQRENLMPWGRKPADVQKLPLTAVEIRDVLRSTLANIATIATDRKHFYQLKERKMLKTRRLDGKINQTNTKKPKPSNKKSPTNK